MQLPKLDRALVGILVLAFVLRTGWVLLALLDPSDGEYFDMVWYHVTALQIAAGNGVVRLDGTPTAVWPPLYPALLAPLYLITDGSLLSGKLLNPFLGVLTTALVFDVGRRLADRRAGLFAAALFAACPDDVFFSNFVMSEAVFAALLMANVWLFSVLQERRPEPGAAAWLGLGLAAGIATLTRGITLAWLAVPITVWLAAVRPLRAIAPRAAWALLGLALVIAPWTIRNLVLMDYPILVASSLGRTLAHAHSPYETGGPSLKTFVYRHQIQKRFEHLPQPRMEVELMREYTRLSLGYMLSHPGHELRILPNRVRHLFQHGHSGLEIGRARLPSGERKPFFGPLRHAAIAGFADLYFYALLLLGVLGLPRLFAGGDRTALVVPLGLGYFAFFHLMVFPADPRYHHPMLPLLALSAGALLAAFGPARASLRARSSPSQIPGPIAKKGGLAGRGLQSVDASGS
jgi:4-amino-4-deoxy-L-arabinose transferase-like glycosyltransferase